MRFYRGLAVEPSEADGVMENIRSEGLCAKTSKGKFLRYRPDLKLAHKADLTIKDTRPDPPYLSVMASGTLEGALPYAYPCNSRLGARTPLVVEFEAEISDAIIDGVDYAYDLFQAGKTFPELEAAVRDIYGVAGLRYARRAWSVREQSYRIAMCDLMVADPEVADFHYRNRNLIRVKKDLSFHNAFAFTHPIPASAIVDVYRPSKPCCPDTPHLALNDVLRRGT